VEALTSELRARSGANISLSPPGPIETDLAPKTATQSEAATAGGAKTTPTVRATAGEAAPAATEVDESAVEENSGKTRAEFAANTPFGQRAGKAAAVAGAAAVATSAIKSSAAATSIVGAQHAAPAARDYTTTRPRTKEMATEVGAAAEVTPAISRNGAASGGNERQKLRARFVPGKERQEQRCSSCRTHRPSTAGWPPPKQSKRRRQPLKTTSANLHGQATGPPCPKGRANTTSPEIDRTEI
jgi:hypothetical protein